MNTVHFRLKVSKNPWDYFPLFSNETDATTESDVVVGDVKFELPAVFLDFFGWGSDQYILEKPERGTVFTESPFLTKVRALLNEGNFELCEEGVGGTYFVRNEEGTKIGVFKPTDEEPGASSNPKNAVSNPLLPPGGGAIREVAAFQLDRLGFASVPETFFMENVKHKGFANNGDKHGSVQRFIPNQGESSDMSASRFPVEDVHRIGSLDIRLFNLDRNGENMLVQKEEDCSYKLVPIDHTYSLPPVTMLNEAYFEWQYWPQAKKPFSQETREYIASLDIEADAATLDNLGFDAECIRTMELSTLFLQAAVVHKWTLFDIANVLCRGVRRDEPSKFENFISKCLNECDDSITSTPFLAHYSSSLGELLESK